MFARYRDAGTTDTGRPYFVMELVEGARITDYCRAQRLCIRDRLTLFIQVCHAIQHAHQKGILHRDIKPSNVLVSMREGAAVPKVKAGDGERARRGFVVFKENCIGCHSVNLVGGDLAPELNVPKNVTEYWRTADIRALVRDASSYRARSKMPPFPQLADADLDALLSYLEAMKRQKICDARRPCPN